MKRIFLILATLGLLGSCSKVGLITYDQDVDGIYFYVSSDVDVIDQSKSFVAYTADSLTLTIPVRCFGMPSEKDRAIKIQLVDSLSTAVEGYDFVPLEDTYYFPAGVSKTTIPITIIDSDTVKVKSVTFTVELLESEDFVIGDPTRTLASFTYSNIIEQPSSWKTTYLSVWTPSKHILFLQLAGLEEFPSATDWTNNYYFYCSVYIRQMVEYYTENYPVYDDYTGSIIEPW